MKHSWTTQKLDDLFEFKYGKGLIAEHREVDGSVKVYGSNGIIGRHNHSLSKGPTVVVGRKGSVGEVHFSSSACWPIDTTYYVDKFPDGFPPKYWAFYLKSLRLGTHDKSSAIPGVSRKDIYGIEVPVPPPAEQRRIVAKLEKLLAGVEACQERLNKIPSLLKRFRQSVLAAACSGRLTADWREENGGNLDEWVKVLLKDVADSRLGKMLDKAKNVGKPTRYLRNLNVRWFSFELTNLAFMKVTPEEEDGLSIRNGDLLVCEGGEPGRCAVWKNGKTDIVFQKAIHRVRPNKNLSPYWLAFNIKNDATSGNLENYFTGTTIKHLTGKSLAQYRFKLSSLAEQQEIVRRVEALFKIADQIEERYKKAKTHVDKLTQSILAKAFRGELVPQDPNDEPVSVLLKRIQQEREKR